MKIKCGVDIIEISRIKESIDNIGNSFLNRVYTKNEIEYCESKGRSKYEHYAARFAVKEAVFKALSEMVDDKYSITGFKTSSSSPSLLQSHKSIVFQKKSYLSTEAPLFNNKEKRIYNNPETPHNTLETRQKNFASDKSRMRN